MKRLFFECLEPRSLPAANPFAGSPADDAPETFNDPPTDPVTPPIEAVSLGHGGGQQSLGPFYPYPQVPLGWRKVALEWDDGWWMLDFSHGEESPPPDKFLTQQPTSKQLDEWERIGHLDQPGHSQRGNSQPEGSGSGLPETLAHEEALPELGGQRERNDGNYFYSHAYTMINGEPSPSANGKTEVSSETNTAPNPLCEEDPSPNGSASATDAEPHVQSGEVNVPDGGTILLGGIKSTEDAAENSELTGLE